MCASNGATAPDLVRVACLGLERTVMDPNTIIEALRGTMDSTVRETAERQLNEVRRRRRGLGARRTGEAVPATRPAGGGGMPVGGTVRGHELGPGAGGREKSGVRTPNVFLV